MVLYVLRLVAQEPAAPYQLADLLPTLRADDLEDADFVVSAFFVLFVSDPFLHDRYEYRGA